MRNYIKHALRIPYASTTDLEQLRQAFPDVRLYTVSRNECILYLDSHTKATFSDNTLCMLHNDITNNFATINRTKNKISINGNKKRKRADAISTYLCKKSKNEELYNLLELITDMYID